MAKVHYDGDSGNLIVSGNAIEIEQIVTFVNHLNGKGKENDTVNHPSHYEHGIECIDEMILLFGVAETMSFCKLNSHKYRKRAFDKGGREDMDKSDWYMKEYAYLDSKSDFEVKEEIYKKYNLNNN